MLPIISTLTQHRQFSKKPNDENLYVKSMYWIPESVIEEQEQKGDRKERDSVPYTQWIADGLDADLCGKQG